MQLTSARFLISTHYSHYSLWHFSLNFSVLLVTLIAKLPMMHKVRLFGIGQVPPCDSSGSGGGDDWKRKQRLK